MNELTTKREKLSKLINLVRQMRQAQKAFDEKRGYGTLVRLPLQKKAQELEQQVDKYLEERE